MSNQIDTYIKKELSSIEQIKQTLQNEKVKITSIGLYNHGKSTLLNALIDDLEEQTFKTADVRETSKNKEVVYENFTFVDTPGLNAKKHDDKRTFDAIKSSDINLFVHNVNTGELNEAEIDFLETIQENWENSSQFLDRTLFILSRIDNISNEEDINLAKEKINKQLFEIFQVESTIIPISAKRYIKGKKENKKLLVGKSKISELKESMNELYLKFEAEIKQTKIQRLEKKYNQFIEKIKSTIEENKLTINQLQNEEKKFTESLEKDINRVETLLQQKYEKVKEI